MAKQEFGVDKSVLQNHHSQNSPPRAPRFQYIHVAPPSRRLPLPNDTKPRTIESYPPQWQQVIIQAKLAFRSYLAGHCGFPDGLDGIKEATECLQDAVEAHRDDGGTLEAGMIQKKFSSLPN